MKQRTLVLLPVLLLALCIGPIAGAEDAPPSPVGDSDNADKYSPEELEEIVGPIALYPDIVISSMLPASTVPTDVIAAARWIGEQDGDITEPPEDSGWDPSVEAMIQFSDVLVWMSENLDWLEMLGYAVAVQESDVLDAIQDFRMKAEEAGNLNSDDDVQVIVEDDVVQIQPASPEIVYVPTYDPVAVVQPGYVWPARSFWTGFAAGAVGAWAFHSIRWGGHGGYGSINVNRNPQFNFNNNGNINTGNIGSGNRWNASNRPSQRPRTNPNRTRPKNPSNKGRPNNKGRPGKGGVKPGGARPGGSKPGSRPGSRPGERPGGAKPSRPGGGKPSTRPGTSRPSKPPSRPSTRPGSSGSRPSKAPSRPSTRPSSSKGNKSMMSGSSNHGRSTQKASSRGNRSMSSSSSRSRSSGASRGGSRSGGSRGGGSRGGGGRGGGGRRR